MQQNEVLLKTDDQRVNFLKLHTAANIKLINPREKEVRLDTLASSVERAIQKNSVLTSVEVPLIGPFISEEGEKGGVVTTGDTLVLKKISVGQGRKLARKWIVNLISASDSTKGEGTDYQKSWTTVTAHKNGFIYKITFSFLK
jgi:hypothetical protein